MGLQDHLYRNKFKPRLFGKFPTPSFAYLSQPDNENKTKLNTVSFIGCGNVTAFFYFALNYTVQNSLWNKQVCPKFNNVMIENNLSHNSGA